MESFLKELKEKFSGEIKTDLTTREFYSHDASMFELLPQAVVAPKDSKDVQNLVKLVAKYKKSVPDLSVTARGAGTDMAGGAINDSVVIDFSKHLNQIFEVTPESGHAQPGVFYRDFEKETLQHRALMPSYPASREMAALGGMIGNNSGGEKSLEYGKTAEFIKELKVVFADGKEYVVKPLNIKELNAKIAQKDFEGKIYKQVFDLCEKHYDQIKAAKPEVSKNSMGYALWDVWDRKTEVFDLTRLIVGAEGTLGMVTDITFRLVPARSHSGLLVLFLKNIDDLGELVPAVLRHKPATFECFDDSTLLLTIKFMPYFLKMLGVRRFIKLCFGLIPDGLQLLRGIPKMILMIEFNADTEEEVRQKIRALHKELAHHRARYEINGFEEDPTEGKSEKFWIMRRNSFQLLRSKVKEKHTAPFIDDFVVPPKYLVDFLPELRKIVKRYKLFATVQGHIGDGNFHVIPLMKFEDTLERIKIQPAQKEVNELVLKYHGSLSGEHNDGLVRGPWLEQQFGTEVTGYMRDVKTIFDPENIFNPHKKTDSNWEYSMSHLREHF